MKKLVSILISCISMICLNAQTLDKFEIWGWDGSKEEFAKIYADSTGKDLRFGYACMADSCDALGDIVYSNVFTEDIEGYSSGTLDWASTERISIIKNWDDKSWQFRSPDSTEMLVINELLETLEQFDSTQIENYFITNQSDLYFILTGTFSEDISTRFRCINILNKHSHLKLKSSNKNLKILADMLCFPDPNTCYAAMYIIENSEFGDFKKRTSKLFENHAQTLVYFLKSNLQNYQSDAINFLTSTYPERSPKSPEEWISWIKSF